MSTVTQIYRQALDLARLTIKMEETNLAEAFIKRPDSYSSFRDTEIKVGRIQASIERIINAIPNQPSEMPLNPKNDVIILANSLSLRATDLVERAKAEISTVASRSFTAPHLNPDIGAFGHPPGPAVSHSDSESDEDEFPTPPPARLPAPPTQKEEALSDEIVTEQQLSEEANQILKGLNSDIEKLNDKTILNQNRNIEESSENTGRIFHHIYHIHRKERNGNDFSSMSYGEDVFYDFDRASFEERKRSVVRATVEKMLFELRGVIARKDEPEYAKLFLRVLHGLQISDKDFPPNVPHNLAELLYSTIYHKVKGMDNRPLNPDDPSFNCNFGSLAFNREIPGVNLDAQLIEAVNEVEALLKRTWEG